MFSEGDSFEFVMTIYYWMQNLFYGFVSAGSWLTSPLVTLGDFSFTPLTLLSFAGITAFIGVAVARWLID